MLLLFTMHHAVAKAALFLGVGIAHLRFESTRTRVLVAAGLVVAGFALPGLPFTSGLAVKSALKYAAAEAPQGWDAAIKALLPFSGIATTLLITRYLWLVWPRPKAEGHRPRAAMVVPWAILCVLVVAGFFIMPVVPGVKASWFSLAPATLWSATWPLLAGLVITFVVIYGRNVAQLLSRASVPHGDIVVPIESGIAALARGFTRLRDRDTPLVWHGLLDMGGNAVRYGSHATGRLMRFVESDRLAGLFLCAVAALIFLLVATAR
jgi:NADH:ubiquinone oxidoreductase subunit 5 (subunit L)/multisubunit Na+/H+ antiporter MnhA subunit